MKKLLVLLLVVLCGVMSVVGANTIIKLNKEAEQQAEHTIAQIEDVSAAVANTKEVQTRLKNFKRNMD